MRPRNKVLHKPLCELSRRRRVLPGVEVAVNGDVGRPRLRRLVVLGAEGDGPVLKQSRRLVCRALDENARGSLVNREIFHRAVPAGVKDKVVVCGLVGVEAARLR